MVGDKLRGLVGLLLSRRAHSDTTRWRIMAADGTRLAGDLSFRTMYPRCAMSKFDHVPPVTQSSAGVSDADRATVTVDHLNTGIAGGAAIAARRLHQALLAAGVDSRFWYARSTRGVPPEPECRPLGPADVAQRCREILTTPAALARKARQKWQQRRALAGRPPGLDLFNDPRRPRPTPWRQRGRGAGIVHLHWVAKLIDYRSFFASIPDHQPVVWTLHDLHPLTGGCHYPGTCTRYRHGCGDCPQLGRPAANDLSRRFFHDKHRALSGKNIHIVTPSRWLEAVARQSPLLAGAGSIRTIHHGLDPALFSPWPKDVAKRQLGLETRPTVIGFGATSIADRRKGYAELLAALDRVRTHRPWTALVFGAGADAPRLARAARQMTVGYLENPRDQAIVYSAADLFVVPSLEEVFGLTGLEALACGTPVVAFDCGGIPDYVRPLETGLLARTGDAPHLARQIQWLIDRPRQRQRMGANGRALVGREFSLQRQAAHHLELYRSLLDARHRTAAGRAA